MIGNWQYDLDADALYVELGDPATIDAQVVISDSLVVDVDGAGRLVGVEVLAVTCGWNPGLVTDAFKLDAAASALLWSLTALRPAVTRSATVVPGSSAIQGVPHATGLVTAGELVAAGA